MDLINIGIKVFNYRLKRENIEFRLKENDSYYIYPLLPNIDEEGFKFCSTFYALNFNDYVYEEKFLFFELIYDDDSLVEEKIEKERINNTCLIM